MLFRSAQAGFNFFANNIATMNNVRVPSARSRAADSPGTGFERVGSREPAPSGPVPGAPAPAGPAFGAPASTGPGAGGSALKVPATARALARARAWFIKHKGRPSDEAVLIGRLIDRPIRSLFPKGYHQEGREIGRASCRERV